MPIYWNGCNFQWFQSESIRYLRGGVIEQQSKYDNMNEI